MSIGVLLGGCGHYDGTDVQEAVLALWAIEAAGEKPVLIAPDIAQERTVDHLSGDEVPELRNVLRESARLARRPVRGLAQVRPDELEALIIPGGFGPAVNLGKGFARRGMERGLHPEVEAFLRACLESGKPIGCISLGEIPVRAALGQEIRIPEAPGDPARLVVDPDRPIVHTPGFTSFNRLGDVKAGVDAMMAEVMRLVRERRRSVAAVLPASQEGR